MARTLEPMVASLRRSRRCPCAVLALLVGIISTGCGGSSDSPTPVPLKPPSDLIYASGEATYTVGVAMAPNAPTSGGGTPTAYTVAPALPAGLALNPTTGVIAGTPTSAAEAAAYTIKASNAAGYAEVAVLVKVAAALQPPTELVYEANPVSYNMGAAIAANTPTNQGGAPTAYTVAPSLPAGLALNPTTGVVTGTPTAATAQATYQVRASNAAGRTEAHLVVTVTATLQPPTALSYATSPVDFTEGKAIAANTPTISGGIPTGYSVTPPLPAGLSLNSVTGDITGTPTTATAQAVYTIRAFNAAGSTSVGLPISVASSGGGTRNVLISWPASKESGVNKLGGGYKVSITGRPDVAVPWVSGRAAPTRTTVQLPRGTYTVTVSSFAALDGKGGNSGTVSEASPPRVITVD